MRIRTVKICETIGVIRPDYLGFKFFYTNVPQNSFWVASLPGFRQTTNDKKQM